MKNYYAMYEKDRPIFDYRVLEGKTPLDAARRAYPGRRVTPVYGDNARYADLILVECSAMPDGAAAGQVKIKYRAKSCCYLIE